jgi:hypothetical protein
MPAPRTLWATLRGKQYHHFCRRTTIPRTAHAVVPWAPEQGLRDRVDDRRLAPVSCHATRPLTAHGDLPVSTLGLGTFCIGSSGRHGVCPGVVSRRRNEYASPCGVTNSRNTTQQVLLGKVSDLFRAILTYLGALLYQYQGTNLILKLGRRWNSFRQRLIGCLPH